MPERYDVIVVGAGHAGAEAAALAARAGARTILLTQNLETIGQMSCNPAIGGIAKGTVVREVDALGGVMGRATDRARIQFRMLNRSKGPAVWSPRAQCDRALYRGAVRSILERQSNLEFAQGTVRELLVHAGEVRGVCTVDGRTFEARATVLTAGTFLRGRIHVGLDMMVPAGRAGEGPAIELARGARGLGTLRSVDSRPARLRGSMAAPWTWSVWPGRRVMPGRSGSPFMSGRRTRDSSLAGLPDRARAFGTSSEPTCTARRSMEEPSAAAARGTVRRSRTKS